MGAYFDSPDISVKRCTVKGSRLFELKEGGKVVFLLLFAQVEHLDTAQRVRTLVGIRGAWNGVEDNERRRDR